MMHGLRVVVVMPAYRAARTLEACYRAIPHDVVDEILLVDDGSDDETLAVARSLGLSAVKHARNLGYGANQKTCYNWALARGADIVVMLHPDYQYEPRLITAMAAMVASGVYDMVLVAGVEKMTSQPTPRVSEILGSAGDCSGEIRAGNTFASLFAMIARRHMHQYGTTREHLAAVAVKNHANGALNPDAHMRRMTLTNQFTI
jgi:glycosyltransferase involved in cell wall biosynthesis